MGFDIAIATTEMRPFRTVGDLGTFVDALAHELTRRGHRVTVFLPDYEGLEEPRTLELESRIDLQVPLGATTENGTLRLLRDPATGVRIAAIGHPQFFDRRDPYVDPATGRDWPDNAKRFVFFNKAILQSVVRLRWRPDLFHLNDHPTALLPMLLKETPDVPEEYRSIGTLFSVHAVEAQGIYDRAVLAETGLPENLAAPFGPLEFFGRVNFMKSALVYADLISTVSPTHAEEMQLYPEVGCGLEGLLRTRRADLVGILHGIDTQSWNPASDEHLPYRFSARDLQGKRDNKIRLLESLQLPVEPEVPLYCWNAPLREDQGFGLLESIAGDLLGGRVKLCILGQGEPRWEALVHRLTQVFPYKISWSREPSPSLTRLALAGSDFCLVIPRREACGQMQMRAMRYGAVPIVHATGGLVDTVRPYSPETGKGEGFVFDEYAGGALLAAIERGVQSYHRRGPWKRLLARLMQLDVSWTRAARAFEPVYARVLERPGRGSTDLI